jgi:hypothetical protein
MNEKRVNALHSSLREQGQALSPRLPQAAYEISPLVRAWRTLLLGPALLRYDDAEAFRVLTEQAERFEEELGATFGWSLELNHDYACIVRGGGISIGSGATISFNGAFDQILLLLCGQFREQVHNKYWTPDSYGCIAVTQWQILPLLSDLRQRYGAHWGTTVQTISAEKLLEEVYQRMRQTGLLRGPDRDGNILILPTAARYSVSYKIFQQADEVPATRSRERKKRGPLKNQQVPLDWYVSQMEEE